MTQCTKGSTDSTVGQKLSEGAKRKPGTSIIDFPNLGSTYNGGWCTATKVADLLRLGETLY